MLRPVEPAKQLKPFVRKYIQLEVSATELWPVPARSITCIEFTFREPYRIHHVDRSLLEIARPAGLIGAKTYSRIRLQLCGDVETFAVFFQPTGLQRLFSLPGREIVNEHYEASAVLGRAMDDLYLQLAETRSFHDRVRIADAYFTKRIPLVHKPCAVDVVVQEIISKRGCVRIPELADQTGVGLRQFERRFVRDLGINPKLYARIVRFEAAMRRKATLSCLNWTQIAHELEYHDQMHMVHDFQLLSGENPTSLAPHFEVLGSIVPQRESEWPS